MKNNRDLALAGIMTAITVMILFAASIIPNLKLVLYGASSLPMAVVLMECDKKTAILFYIATSALALVMIPNKIAILPYVILLGLYGFVKSIAEKNTTLIIEWAIKLIYFNATLGLYLWLIIKILLPNITFAIGLWLLILGAELVFVAYDFIYSFCVSYYCKHIRPKVNSFNNLR